MADNISVMDKSYVAPSFGLERPSGFLQKAQRSIVNSQEMTKSFKVYLGWICIYTIFLEHKFVHSQLNIRYIFLDLYMQLFTLGQWLALCTVRIITALLTFDNSMLVARTQNCTSHPLTKLWFLGPFHLSAIFHLLFLYSLRFNLLRIFRSS